jgi:hypothetical protein
LARNPRRARKTRINFCNPAVFQSPGVARIDARCAARWDECGRATKARRDEGSTKEEIVGSEFPSCSLRPFAPSRLPGISTARPAR